LNPGSQKDYWSHHSLKFTNREREMPNLILPAPIAQLVLFGFLVLSGGLSRADGLPFLSSSELAEDEPSQQSQGSPKAPSGLKICGPRIKEAISLACRQKSASVFTQGRIVLLCF